MWGVGGSMADRSTKRLGLSSSTTWEGMWQAREESLLVQTSWLRLWTGLQKASHPEELDCNDNQPTCMVGAPEEVPRPSRAHSMSCGSASFAIITRVGMLGLLMGRQKNSFHQRCPTFLGIVQLSSDPKMWVICCFFEFLLPSFIEITHRIHVWYIYLQNLVAFYGNL